MVLYRLYAHGKIEEARKILVKYHGNGRYTPIVAKELDQIILSLNKAPQKMFDYRNLANTRAKAYRLMLALIMGAASQVSFELYFYCTTALSNRF